ncbi:MAG TPA: hypothetical protein VHH73_02770, partial [Verrucomicrobiae bacterium]|nr:hypothetical protein [Verrucomicrobiae bacterium]
FEKVVVDTPAADVLSDGTDNPAAPYLATGYFTLGLYQDYDAAAEENPYQAIFDNAEVYVTDTVTLDDFNDNTKTGWTDFTFQPGFGVPKESSGQFRFEQPPAGQAIFSLSQKTSRQFSITEGERLEFRVDVVEGGDKDSFAVLAFIPAANPASSLAGYGFAKSSTDVLITKSATQFFYNENPTPSVKQNNITMVLSLTGKDGNVILDAKVLDKEDNDNVIFEKVVVDTPAADVLSDGKDSPAAPYFASGYFTLCLYQDYDAAAPESPYKAYFDNAVVSAPPVTANTPPIISDLQPAEFSSFLPASTAISFHATDDKPIPAANLTLFLNGQVFTSTNGLTVTGGGTTNVTASYTGLKTNVDYTASIVVQDADKASVTNTFYFDTFLTGDFVVEVEDYNFGGGQFIDNPVPVAEASGPVPNAYCNQDGVQGTDFNETRTDPRSQDSIWRQNDPVRMAHTLDNARDKYVAAGGADAGVFDYDVGDIAADEWLQYTRTFPAGTYEVYLRESVANMASGSSLLELVTGDRTQPDATTQVLGSFLGVTSGYKYRNFPLTDGSGQSKLVVRLSGVVTLRLHQITADPGDGARRQNYLLFLPVADTGQQSPTVASVSPANGTTVETVTPAITATIQNRDTTVRGDSVQLTLNGMKVAATVQTNASGATINYNISPLPASGVVNNAQIQFTDSAGTPTTFGWSFTITYHALDPANARSGPGKDPGFSVRVVQAPPGSALENSLDRAERQLAANSTIPKVVDTNAVVDVINFDQIEGATAGDFQNDLTVPGIDGSNGYDDYVVELLAYLDLPAGVHRFGATTDDGYKITSGTSFTDLSATPLGFHNGGTANNETFDFVVTQAGLYPFRVVWYERGGGAHAEIYSVDLNTGDKTLINDSASPNAIKAYRNVTAPTTSVQLQSSDTVKGAYATEVAAIINDAAKTITLPLPPGNRFYRVGYTSASQIHVTVHIKGIFISGANLVLTYELTP